MSNTGFPRTYSSDGMQDDLKGETLKVTEPG
jgi:hypothetical protein